MQERLFPLGGSKIEVFTHPVNPACCFTFTIPSGGLGVLDAVVGGHQPRIHIRTR